MKTKQENLFSQSKSFLFSGVGRNDFLALLFMLILQQVIVASSSYWLSQFARQLEQNRVSFQWLSLFCISLLLPYLPGAISLYFLKRWELRSQGEFWNKTMADWSRFLPVWNDHPFKSRQTTLLVKDGPQILSDTTKLCFDLLSTALNVSLNLIVIGFILDYKSIVAFTLGTGILLLFSLKMRHKTRWTSECFENSKKNLSVCLNNSWDNQILNNSLNKNLWNEEFHQLKTDLYTKAMASLRAQEITSTLMSTLAYLPMIALILVYAVENQNQPSQLISMIVLFPRIFMLLNMMTSFLFHLRSISGLTGRWNSVSETLHAQSLSNLETRMKPALLNITFQNPSNPELQRSMSVEDLLSGHETQGRITVRGANGSGKSTLLTLLKQKYGPGAFLLPTRSDLKFNHSVSTGSSGQILQNSMREALADPSVGIFLLDEWDANLDQNNKHNLDLFLQEHSKERLIIEIRH